MRVENSSGTFFILETCGMCGHEFNFGHGRYDGKNIAPWSLLVCRTCHVMNWDGIVESQQPKLMGHLAKVGVKIEYNESGWIKWPVGYEPPPPSTPRQPSRRRRR